MVTLTDDDCAHCVLGHDLAVFLKEHPGKCRSDLIQELVQMVAEVTAHSVPRDALTGYSLWLQRRLGEEIQREAESMYHKRGLTS